MISGDAARSGGAVVRPFTAAASVMRDVFDDQGQMVGPLEALPGLGGGLDAIEHHQLWSISITVVPTITTLIVLVSGRVTIMSVRRRRQRSTCSVPQDLGSLTRSDIAGFRRETCRILWLLDILKRPSENKIHALRVDQVGLTREPSGGTQTSPDPWIVMTRNHSCKQILNNLAMR